MTDVTQRLAAFAEVVEWPAPTDVWPQVEAAVASSPTATRSRRRAPSFIALKPAFAAGAMVLVLAAGVFVASPGARHAVASWLGLPGVTVRVRDEVTPPATTDLRLGVPVDLRAAQERVDFAVAQLDLTGGRPFLDGELVHIVYPPQAGVAEASSGVGALLTQFRGRDEPAFTKEILGGSGNVVPTDVGGEFALWVEGPSHLLVPNDNGTVVRHESRLSDNALLWTSAAGVTYRLESALSHAAAVRLAERLR